MQSQYQDANYDWIAKILLLGDSNVGKSNFLARYTMENYEQMFNQPTIGLDYKNKLVFIDNHAINLQIWDTAGHERFRNVTRQQFNGKIGFFIMYAIDERRSFESVEYWIDQLNLCAMEKSIVIILGNKCDSKNRCVQYDEGLELAKMHNMKFFETSSFDNINVSEAFLDISQQIYTKILVTQRTQSQPIFTSQISKIENKKQYKCCKII